MSARDSSGAIEDWLKIVQARIAGKAPPLLDLFDVYANEARFGRRFIAPDLENLAGGARILEIGAGSLLLSCQLRLEGFDVTALEPIGQGFSHFGQLQEIVMDCADLAGCLPAVMRCSAEELRAERPYDYAFSINVMEHVTDWERVLRRVIEALAPSAAYRFTCPNYLFPYEPHFDIPTLFSKHLTELVFGARIRSAAMPDPSGTWRSLNWITVPSVRAAVRKLPGVAARFDRTQLEKTLCRVVQDAEFSSRRSPALRAVLTVAVALGLHRLAHLIPVTMQPLMDCTVQNREA